MYNDATILGMLKGLLMTTGLSWEQLVDLVNNSKVDLSYNEK